MIQDEARESWNTLARELGKEDNRSWRSTYTELEKAYTYPKRKHHTLEHVLRQIREVDSIPHLVEDSLSLKLMIWGQHVEYYPGDRETYHRSAEWMAREMASASVNNKLIATVFYGIRYPEEGLKPTPDRELLRTLNRAIYGAPPDVYDKFVEDLGSEFTAYCGDSYGDWCETWLYWVQLLLKDEKPLFSTEYGIEKYETQARQNLRRNLSRMTLDLVED